MQIEAASPLPWHADQYGNGILFDRGGVRVATFIELIDADFAVRAVNAHGALVEALRAAIGYMENARIDLDTGAPKRTAIATLSGGLKQARAALKLAEG